MVLRSDVIHSGVYGYAGNTRFHMVIRFENLLPELDKLRQFKGETAKPEMHWSTAYKIQLEVSKPYSDFYTWFFENISIN